VTYRCSMAIDRSATSDGHPLRDRSAEPRGWGENREVAQASGIPPSRFSPEPSEAVRFFLGLEIVAEVIGFWIVSWLVTFMFWSWAAGYFGGG